MKIFIHGLYQQMAGLGGGAVAPPPVHNTCGYTASYFRLDEWPWTCRGGGGGGGGEGTGLSVIVSP